MERPQVQIVENQYESSSPVSISRSEEIALLSKYGYKPSDFDNQIQDSDVKSFPSFEELIELENRKASNHRSQNKMDNVNTFSIERDRIQHYDSNYRTLDENSQYGFEIQIVSDMKITKY